MKNIYQKGNIGVLLIIVVLVLAAFYLLGNKTSQPYQQSTTVEEAIQNDNDLISASEDLDNTNVDSMDTELSQNDQDAATF